MKTKTMLLLNQLLVLSMNAPALPLFETLAPAGLWSMIPRWSK